MNARTGGETGADAVYSFITWPEGRFDFVPGEPLERTPLDERFDRLLLESCRRLDEERRAG